MNKNLLNILKNICSVVFFITTILTFLISIFLLVEFYKLPEISKDKLTSKLSTTIYDRDNNVIAILGNERREFIEVEKVPDTLKEAVLSIEDTRFYEHTGIDPKRIIKALFVNAISGEALEGGSTITQQVVKQSLLTSTKSYERKLQEAFLSLELEKKYDKNDILEMYLNKIFYSDNRYGILTASKYFYGKELDELTIPQIALLAGIPQQPIAYNPYDNPEGAKSRRDTVLYAMYSNNKLSKEDYEKYIEVPITDGLVEKTKSERMIQGISNPQYAAYIDFVVKEIKNLNLFPEDKDPFSLGLNIYTNLDKDLQSSVQGMLDTESSPMIKSAAQAAITVLDTKSGLVEAIGGGKNYTYGDFNFATDSKLQPGSSIKPILDYAPGIEYYGWDSATIFSDTAYLIAGTNHYVQNWDRRYHGNVTMRKSVAQSYNIPAIRAFEALGFERSKYFASKLGINILSKSVTTAIGGSSETVSPIQMAGAFAAFGNKGMYNKPSALIKILDKDGNEIQGIKEEAKRAMNESTAFIMTDILKDVISGAGTSPGGRIVGFDMAAKSGSSTFDENLANSLGIDAVRSTKDSWMVGYTTEHTVAIWQGPDNIDSKEKALNINQAESTQLIFARIMKLAHKDKIPAKFKVPSSVKQENKIYFATDRSTETDNMYVGTNLDSVYQYKLSEKVRTERNNSSLLANIKKILPTEEDDKTKNSNSTSSANTKKNNN
ncbi:MULTISPECIES: transglycosylase domain-containing protein [unclassified Gemella]|uniref:transglycosylase domain-containing protein n=1 Tax=unclassified Gemella TaxID=2624949 RepID=UPI001C04FB0D|nr:MULTISPECIES: PBP1A family penicillin-binding protein [unclassified Gemella]MBU0278645.1 PBP1A family penicillin-binding protein [Gemella sp. zg-1178]QWQ39201.1 PBP1A family penicillin-binding protein [Gemella sp. zg-570]